MKMGKDYREVIEDFIIAGDFQYVNMGGKHPNGIKHIPTGIITRFPTSPSDVHGCDNFRRQISRVRRDYLDSLTKKETQVDISIPVKFTLLGIITQAEQEQTIKCLEKALQSCLTDRDAFNFKATNILRSADLDRKVIFEFRVA